MTLSVGASRSSSSSLWLQGWVLGGKEGGQTKDYRGGLSRGGWVLEAGFPAPRPSAVTRAPSISFEWSSEIGLVTGVNWEAFRLSTEWFLSTLSVCLWFIWRY